MRITDKILRTYTTLDKVDATIAFYEGLQGSACELRFEIPERSIKGAKIGVVLILAGSEVDIAPVRAVQAIFYVDALDEFVSWLAANGAEILHGPHEISFGRNVTVRHPDGSVIEYFEPGSNSQG